MSETPIRPATAADSGLRGVDGYPHRWIGAFPVQPIERGLGGNVSESPTLLAAAMAELTLTLRRARDEAEALDVVVRSAVTIVGAGQAGIVASAGPIAVKVRSAEGDLPRLLVGLENDLGEGPHRRAVRESVQVVIDAMESDARWTEFAAAAREWDVHGIVCTPLAADGRQFGVLTLLFLQPVPLSTDVVVLAAVFAAHAALALAAAAEARHLSAMARSREVIGQAMGILMERHKLTSAAAFDLLVRISQHHNIKLRDLARQLTDTGEIPRAPVA